MKKQNKQKQTKTMASLATAMQICCTGYEKDKIRCSQFKILTVLIVGRFCHPHIKERHGITHQILNNGP